MVPVLALYLGTVWSLLSIFELPLYVWWSSLTGVVLLLLLQAGGKLRKVGYGIAGLSLAAMLLFLLSKQTPVYQGLLLVWNDAASALGHHTEVVLREYLVTASKGQQPLCYLLFTGTTGVLAAAVCYAIAESRRNVFLLLIVLPILILELICGMGVKSWPVLILLLGIFLIMCTSFLRGPGKKKNVTVGRNWAFFQVSVVTMALFAAVMLLLQLVLPSRGYEKSDVVVSIQEAISDGLDHLRYEKKEASSFNQGQFDKLGDLKLTKRTALRVVMDEPTSMYLRGFVGSEYTSTGWEETEGKEVYKEKDLFYWLHETGFDGLTQLASIYRLENPGSEDENVQVTVQNVNANSKYLYVPYELETGPSSLEDVRSVGDERLESEKLMGSRVYSYQTAGNLVKQYPQIASKFYQDKEEESFKVYTEDESYYNSFVYKQYTDMPSDVAMLLREHLNTERREGKDHATYEEANTLITSYLNQHIKYSEKITPFRSGDFLQNLLEINATGYSVHYATAATMMYRYLGIPARYVEGYLVTPDLVADAEEYQEISVTGKQAHAWVEIYQDGIGWVPMEVTPPYFDVMERPDYEIVADGGQGDEGQEGSGEDGQSEDVQDETPDIPEERTKVKRDDWGTVILVVVISLLAVLLAAVVAYVLYRRHRLRNYLREIKDADNRKAVCMLGQYMARWLCYVKLWDGKGSRYGAGKALEQLFGGELAEQYQKAVEVIQRAAYSDAEITDEERRNVVQTFHTLQGRILQTCNLGKKIRMRVVDFLY